MSTLQSNENSSEWSTCPEGVLCSLGSRMRIDHTRRNVLKAAGGVASLAVVALMAVSLMPASDPGGISCSQCAALMPDYHLHLTAESDLTTGEAEAMASHLATCDKCRNHFESQYPGVLAAAVSAGLGWVSLALLGARRA